MLPMGEGPFPYARDSLYCSKPVRPFSWPVCPHSLTRGLRLSDLFGFTKRKAFAVTANSLHCKTCHTVPDLAGPAIGSIHKPSHADVHYHSKRQERE